MNRDDPAKLGLDLFDHAWGAGGDHGDAAPVAGVVDLGDGQAFDVVATAREQPDHTGEDTCLVVDDHRQRVPLDRFLVIIAQIIGGMAGRALFDFQGGHFWTPFRNARAIECDTVIDQRDNHRASVFTPKPRRLP